MMNKSKDIVAYVLTTVLAISMWLISGFDDKDEQLQIMRAFFTTRISSETKLEHIYIGSKQSMSTVMAAYRMDTEGFSQIKACLEKGGWELKKERADNESLSLEYENKGYKYLLTEYKQKGVINEIISKE
jgi:hypothetical protein